MSADASTIETARARGTAGLTVGLALALAALVLLAFSPSFQAHFVNWDDPYTVADLRKHGGDVWHFWYATGEIDPWQPLAWWTMMIERALGGLDAGEFAPQAGRFHTTSVVIHALAALAFFALARTLLAITAPTASARARTTAAAVAAAFFALHPLRVESVAWLSERRDVLSGLFYLLAATAWLRALPSVPARVVSKRAAIACGALAVLGVLAFHASVELPKAEPARWRALGPAGFAASLTALAASIPFAARASGRQGRHAAWFTLACACFALALCSKALTVVLPVLLLVLDVWPLKRAERPSLVALVVEKLPLFAMAMIVGAFARWAQVRAGKTMIDWVQHTAGERVAQAFYGLGFYPSRTLAPVELSPLYELPGDVRFGEARYWVSALVVIALTLALVALRKRWPALLVAWIAFGLAIAPVIGLTQAGPQIVADRYSYLSCMPFALLAGGAWLAWSQRSATSRIAASVAAFAVIGALAAATHAQTATWRDSETMWSRAVRIDPSNSAAHSMLAAAINERAEQLGDSAERTALRLEVDRLYRRAFELESTPIPARWRNFGTNLLRLERPQEALEPLARYVNECPDDADGQTNYGLALRMVGRAQEGVVHMRRAVEIDPSSPKNWMQLAQTLESLGDRAGALAAYEQVARLWPRHEPTRKKIAQLRGG